MNLAIELAAEGHVMLAGNHEYVVHRVLEGLERGSPDADRWANRWLQNYQSQTLYSYGIDYGGGRTPNYWAEKLRQNMAPSHFNFLAGLPWIYENDQLVAIHAGLDPNQPRQDQTDSLRAKQTKNPRGPEQLFSHELAKTAADLGKLVVSGHCSRQKPYISPQRVMLDCGVDGGGKLVAYVADGGEIVA